MPATKFRCPDGQFIEIKQCLQSGGCRFKIRCALLPYLRFISEEREWKGLTPSRAGTGPRKILLEQTTEYIIDPNKRVWAVFGMVTHFKLSIHKFTYNVLSEEPMSDEEMRGIPDALQEDEWREGSYILGDYKTWGSFKVAKAQGVVKIDEPILGADGKPLVFKSGKRKGQQKTKQKFLIDPNKIDLRAEEYQLNRYRIFFEKCNFPISEMWLQVTPRDGGTIAAFSRHIMNNLYMIPVRRLPDSEVLIFYAILQTEVNEAFKTGWARRCNAFESWEGRRCKVDQCEVYWHCQDLDKRGK